MKRLLACLLAVLLCGSLTACGADSVDEVPVPEEEPVTTEFDAAITTYLSLLWQADPAAVDVAAPDALYAHLQKEGYGDKAIIKDYVTRQQSAIQINLHGEELASFEFTLVECEQYNEENTATVKQKLSLDYGIDKATVSAAYTVMLDTVGTTKSGSLLAIDAMQITVITVNGTHYVLEAMDLINDYAYQQWQSTPAA